MNKYIKNSLKLKILLPVIFLYLVVSVVIYIITINSIKITLQAEFRSKGKAIINTLASSIQETILNRDSSTVQGYIDQYRNIEGISFIIILDENNKILAHTFYPKVPDEYLKIAKEKIKNDLIITEEILNDNRELVLARPILNGLLGHIYMGMGIEKRETAVIHPLVKKIVLAIGICVLIALFLIAIYLNIILRPILYLTKIADNYAHGSGEVEKIETKSNDEIGQLTNSFHTMIDKITENTKWLEREVKNRTEIINDQQISLLNASKMSALGEMAGGIAHEINTPLAIISMRVELMNDSIEENDFTTEELQKSLASIKSTTHRIAKIINGLRFFARDGSKLPMEKISVDTLLEDTLSFCSEKMRLHSVSLEIQRLCKTENLFLNCRSVEISQVLINLLNNASDAIAELENKWIHITIRDLGSDIEFGIIDSGSGIPLDMQEKIMQPFFTTKEVGKGTGLGLSISRGIIESHQGKLLIDKDCPNTKFILVLPKYISENDGV